MKENLKEKDLKITSLEKKLNEKMTLLDTSTIPSPSSIIMNDTNSIAKLNDYPPSPTDVGSSESFHLINKEEDGGGRPPDLTTLPRPVLKSTLSSLDLKISVLTTNLLETSKDLSDAKESLQNYQLLEYQSPDELVKLKAEVNRFENEISNLKEEINRLVNKRKEVIEGNPITSTITMTSTSTTNAVSTTIIAPPTEVESTSLLQAEDIPNSSAITNITTTKAINGTTTNGTTTATKILVANEGNERESQEEESNSKGVNLLEKLLATLDETPTSSPILPHGSLDIPVVVAELEEMETSLTSSSSDNPFTPTPLIRLLRSAKSKISTLRMSIENLETNNLELKEDADHTKAHLRQAYQLLQEANGKIGIGEVKLNKCLKDIERFNQLATQWQEKEGLIIQQRNIEIKSLENLVNRIFGAKGNKDLERGLLDQMKELLLELDDSPSSSSSSSSLIPNTIESSVPLNATSTEEEDKATIILNHVNTLTDGLDKIQDYFDLITSKISLLLQDNNDLTEEVSKLRRDILRDSEKGEFTKASLAAVKHGQYPFIMHHRLITKKMPLSYGHSINGNKMVIPPEPSQTNEQKEKKAEQEQQEQQQLEGNLDHECSTLLNSSSSSSQNTTESTSRVQQLLAELKILKAEISSNSLENSNQDKMKEKREVYKAKVKELMKAVKDQHSGSESTPKITFTMENSPTTTPTITTTATATSSILDNLNSKDNVAVNPVSQEDVNIIQDLPHSPVKKLPERCDSRYIMMNEASSDMNHMHNNGNDNDIDSRKDSSNALKIHYSEIEPQSPVHIKRGARDFSPLLTAESTPRHSLDNSDTNNDNTILTDETSEVMQGRNGMELKESDLLISQENLREKGIMKKLKKV